MKKGYGRNYWALVFEGTMFTGGIIALSTGGAVALFINTMTGSNTLIGLAVTLQALFLPIGQLIGAPYINTIRKLPEFVVKGMTIQRIIPLFIAIPLFFGVGNYGAVTIFMILFTLFWFVDGIISLAWGELCARAVKPELRGHMMGMMTTTGGVLSLIVGLLFAWLLATPILSDYNRFGFIFTLGSILLLLTVIGIKFVRDPNPIKKPEKLDVKKFYAQIPIIIRRSKPLQYILIARIPSYIGFAAVSFIVVFGKNALYISAAQVSWLVYAAIIGGIVSGVVLGEASRLYGNKSIVLICNIGVFIALCMAIVLSILPNLGYIWLFATVALASFTANNWFGYLNYFLDIAPVEDRSAYQLVGQLVGIPFSFAGLIMGVVVDRFGYVIMFIVCGVFAIITTFLSLKLLSKNKIADFRVQMEENSTSNKK